MVQPPVSSDDLRPKYSFDEFELYYKSTETVTERRLSLNRWNYSICIAIIVAVAGVFNWGFQNPSFLMLSLIAISLICVIALLFCYHWIKQIQDFKQLNNAKFTVLNGMAKDIFFSDSLADNRRSFLPFEKEWEILKEEKAVGKIRGIKNIEALDSSKIEILLPYAFSFFFILAIIFTILILWNNWHNIPDLFHMKISNATCMGNSK